MRPKKSGREWRTRRWQLGQNWTEVIAVYQVPGSDVANSCATEFPLNSACWAAEGFPSSMDPTGIKSSLGRKIQFHTHAAAPVRSSLTIWPSELQQHTMAIFKAEEGLATQERPY